MVTAVDAPELTEEGATVSAAVQRSAAEGIRPPEPDWIAAEVPLEVRVGGKPFTILMRTPGHDEELVRGLFFAEGIIQAASDLRSMRAVVARKRPQAGDVVDVELAHGRHAPRGLPRRCGRATESSPRPGLRCRAPRRSAP